MHRSSIFSLEGGLDGLPLRVSSQSRPSISRVAWLILDCARRTRHSYRARSASRRTTRLPIPSFQARLFSLQGLGLIDLGPRAAKEGSPRPRVARAQESI